MIRAFDDLDFALRSRPNERWISREAIVAMLGPGYSSGFTDSSESEFLFHLAWPCGCAARKRDVIDRHWFHAPCEVHALST